MRACPANGCTARQLPAPDEPSYPADTPATGRSAQNEASIPEVGAASPTAKECDISFMEPGGSSIGPILTLAALVLLSAFFSSTETAFSSVNKARLKALAKQGNRRAQRALDLADRYDQLLSTILIGNNIVNIFASALATMVFITHFGDVGVTLSTAVMTVVILIFGEISPKTLAKEYAEAAAMAFAPAIGFLMKLFTPLNWLFTQWKKLLHRALPGDTEQGMTEEEFLTIVDEAEQEGGLDEHESDLIRSAVEFNDLCAEDILTHRVDVVSVDVTDSMEEVGRVFRESGFSRLPVCEDNLDSVVGVIHEKDFYARPDAASPAEIMHPALFVTPGSKISALLRVLQKEKSHIAIVTDEYGGTAGIVTLEDIIEELVGEIYDEHDEIVEEFRRQPDGSYLVDCSAELTKLQELMDIPGEFDATTVSGWVVDQLGRIPEVGETFTSGPLTVRVTRVDATRVLEISISRRDAAESGEEKGRGNPGVSETGASRRR